MTSMILVVQTLSCKFHRSSSWDILSCALFLNIFCNVTFLVSYYLLHRARNFALIPFQSHTLGIVHIHLLFVSNNGKNCSLCPLAHPFGNESRTWAKRGLLVRNFNRVSAKSTRWNSLNFPWHSLNWQSFSLAFSMPNTGIAWTFVK